ncbi:hypothetical protein JXA02_02125, partial [candidate division KSB1 bacterium]|nr:hypothetical protein [candidate division KSB1 bacterium]
MLIILSLLLIVQLIGCHASGRATLTIQVKAENMPPHTGVYLIDAPPQFGRNMGRRTLTVQDSLWTTSISARIGSTFRFRIARGRWHAEAVDSSGIEFPDFQVVVKRDTTITIEAPRWRDQLKGPPLISRSRFENKSWMIDLIENWKFHAGDDTTWAAVDVDEGDWQPIRTQLRNRRNRPEPPRQALPDTTRRRPRQRWDGIGWFRLRVMVDSSVVNFPLSLHIWQNGASEIYLDGRKLYTFGQVSSIADLEQIYMERNPKPLVFSSPGEHVLAVRYSFHEAERLIDIPTGHGFEMKLGHLERAIAARAEQIRTSSFQQLVFTAIPLCFAIMHLLLFIFSRQNKNNLYYALSMLFFAVMAYTQFGHTFTTTRGAFFWLIVLEMLATVLAIVFGMFSVYSTIYKKLPRF